MKHLVDVVYNVQTQIKQINKYDPKYVAYVDAAGKLYKKET